MSISLKQMRYFVAAAESGRISQAAARLNISQSAVTTAIQQLETFLGTPLLDRNPDGVSVTDAGTRFLARSLKILQAVDECVRDTRTQSAQSRKTLRIGITPTISGYFLPRHLARFQIDHPDIVVELFEGPRAKVEKALFDGQIDLAVLLTSNLHLTDHLSSRTLLRSPRRLWIAPQHPIGRLERVALADVANCPYVMLSTDEAEDTTLRYWADRGLKPNTVLSTASIEAVRSMVGSGLAVTILSDLIFRSRSFCDEKIDTYELVDPVPTMDIGFVWRTSTGFKPSSRVFCDFLDSAVTGMAAGAN